MPKIMIVDDNPQNLYLLEILLGTNGYEVAQASDGFDAFEMSKVSPPDLIISDILMPKMDGFTLCKNWRADEKLKDIPFIFYTATYTEEKDKEFALSLGADRFFIKPMDPSEIISSVKQLLESYEREEQPDRKYPSTEEGQFLREYNEVLVRKLEHKMLQLKKTNSRLFALFFSSTIFNLHKPYEESVYQVLNSLTEKAGYEKAAYFRLENADFFSFDSIGFEINTVNKFKEEMGKHRGSSFGLVGKCIKTRAAINTDSVQENPDWQEDLEGIKSLLYMPVQYDDQLFGVLGLYSTGEDSFSEEDEQILFTLTHNLAISISNRISQKQIQTQMNRLASLHQIDMSINSSSDLSLTLSIVLSNVIAQLNVIAADIVLIERFSNEMKVAAKSGFMSLLSNDAIYTNQITQKVIRQQKTLNVDLTEMELPNAWAKEGFKTYWGVPIISKGVVRGVLEVFNKTIYKPDQDWLDFLETLGGQAAIAIDNVETFDNLINSNLELQMAYDSTIEGWSKALDLRDKETEGHTQRVTELSVAFAQKLGISQSDIIHIRRGALLHDIGKIGVPDHILLKPGPLTDEEWVIMKKHPETAMHLISGIKYLNKAIEIPFCHHEKWDGTGYPRGLRGNDIPIAARLFAIVDVWDALSSDRPYRAAWPVEKIYQHIIQGSGTHFDPDLVPVFLKIHKE
ncbi:MAG: HD domain-containing phosphohydrolase [Anaerolineaceae bacterium]